MIVTKQNRPISLRVKVAFLSVPLLKEICGKMQELS